jgi:all-trans-8'-apo-beta-carotenal 15,15'-oxygenase
MHPTWTTLAPHWFENIPGIPTLSHAGIAAVVKRGQLLAFNEVGLPYCLDANSLETPGPG